MWEQGSWRLMRETWRRSLLMATSRVLSSTWAASSDFLFAAIDLNSPAIAHPKSFGNFLLRGQGLAESEGPEPISLDGWCMMPRKCLGLLRLACYPGNRPGRRRDRWTSPARPERQALSDQSPGDHTKKHASQVASLQTTDTKDDKGRPLRAW
jgi:hypothetical protein